MKTIKVTSTEQIKLGDKLIIEGNRSDLHYVGVAVEKLIPIGDEVEVLINRKKNTYFNLHRYLSGHSWARGVWVVTFGEAETT